MPLGYEDVAFMRYNLPRRPSIVKSPALIEAKTDIFYYVEGYRAVPMYRTQIFGSVDQKNKDIRKLGAQTSASYDCHSCISRTAGYSCRRLCRKLNNYGSY